MSEVLVSCEHGGNRVPGDYASLFKSAGAQQWLVSHRGYDPGSIVAARQFSKALHSTLIHSTTTRLLVDLNRSRDNPDLFSKFSRCLTTSQRQTLLRRHYEPYRKSVLRRIDSIHRRSSIAIHLSIHTFTPRFRGKWRPLEVGLLYDPASATETQLCLDWRDALRRIGCRARVRMNQPYAGIDDGLTTMLRKQFPSNHYAGIEVEINHRLFKQGQSYQTALVAQLIQAWNDVTRQSS